MAIERTDVSIFDSSAQAWVNPVNCVGVMGAGLAREFKARFPANYEAYKQACSAGEMRPGRVLLHAEGPLSVPEWVVNFPTKNHWQAPSKIEYIHEGLRDLAAAVGANGIASVSMPWIGCGLGGLSWHRDVAPMVEEVLGGASVRVVVHRPPRT